MKNPDKKDSFILHTSQYDSISKLSLEDRGLFITAIYQYASTGQYDELPPLVDMAFSFVRQRIDEDNDHYQKVCEKRAAAGRKGGAPKGNKNASKSDSVAEENNQKQPKTTKNNQNNLSDTNTDTESSDEDKKEGTKVPKKKPAFSLSLSDSQKAELQQHKDWLMEQIAPYVDIYGRDICNDFYKYWTEPERKKQGYPAHPRLRYQLQKTFDVGRRLGTFVRNAETNFGRN